MVNRSIPQKRVISWVLGTKNPSESRPLPKIRRIDGRNIPSPDCRIAGGNPGLLGHSWIREYTLDIQIPCE